MEFAVLGGRLVRFSLDMNDVVEQVLNGPGVPADQHESIFELMVRGSDTESSGVDGLGIGLATCRRIVASHGGDLGVDTARGGGAAFWFELPTAEQESVAV